MLRVSTLETFRYVSRFSNAEYFIPRVAFNERYRSVTLGLAIL